MLEINITIDEIRHWRVFSFKIIIIIDIVSFKHLTTTSLIINNNNHNSSNNNY